MRVTLNIPDDLLREVQQIAHEKSRTMAIIRAMEAFVRGRKMEELRALRGKITIDYDWEREEAREMGSRVPNH